MREPVRARVNITVWPTWRPHNREETFDPRLLGSVINDKKSDLEFFFFLLISYAVKSESVSDVKLIISHFGPAPVPLHKPAVASRHYNETEKFCYVSARRNSIAIPTTTSNRRIYFSTHPVRYLQTTV